MPEYSMIIWHIMLLIYSYSSNTGTRLEKVEMLLTLNSDTP